jgi:hypothetical protein
MMQPDELVSRGGAAPDAAAAEQPSDQPRPPARRDARRAAAPRKAATDSASARARRRARAPAAKRTRPAAHARRTPWPQAAAGAAALTLAEEIAALRDLIRQAWKEGAEAKDIVRMVDALGRALKVQYGLEGRAAQGLEEALARALAEIGNELGMTL